MKVYNAIKEKYYDHYLELKSLDGKSRQRHNIDTLNSLISNEKFICFLCDDDTIQIDIGKFTLCVNFDKHECFINSYDKETDVYTRHEPLPDTMLEFTLMYGRLPQIPSQSVTE